ncbi:unnamed protein product [Periconia digitata]|uniref:Uncharacterized protein n=1 Tax=Periconia digitata TaxID=1303443 RepID=A0A9W4U6R6_9PLEO|nr:unnamed protein product [Periconia digitata]
MVVGTFLSHRIPMRHKGLVYNHMIQLHSSFSRTHVSWLSPTYNSRLKFSM